MSTDLFAIAKAIARQYEDERKARQLDRLIQLDEEGYGDEARLAARDQAQWWEDFNDRNPK